MKRLLLLLFLVGCNNHQGTQTEYQRQNEVVPPTPIPTITESDCVASNGVWMTDSTCRHLNEFILPKVDSHGISFEKIETIQKEYAKALYSMEKIFNRIARPERMHIGSYPVTRILESGIYIDVSAGHPEIEAALFEKGVKDPQLECTFEGFAGANFAHVLAVRDLILNKVKKMPILDSVTLSVSGSHLEKPMQVIPDNRKFIVVIDAYAIGAQDIDELLEKIGPK